MEFENKKKPLFKKFRKKLLGMTPLIMMGFIFPTVFAQAPVDLKESNQLHKTAAQVNVKMGFFSKKKINIILQIPTLQAYGFAGEAETLEQKAAVDSVVDSLKQNINNIIDVDPALECSRDINKIDNSVTAQANYIKSTPSEKKKITSEFKVLRVDLDLKCLKDLPRQKIKIDLSQNFKDINKIFVNLDSKQKRKIVIDGSSGEFKL